MEKKLSKTTSVALLTAAALGAVVLSNKPVTGVFAATNDGYVGTAENSQDVDPTTLTEAQKAATKQRDDAQNKVDKADAATSAASTAAASAAAAQSVAQTSVASASAAVSSAAKNVTPTDGVTQAQKDADVASAASAVTTAAAAVSSAQTQQAQKASDVSAAQSKVDTANAALSAAQSGTVNGQKSANVQSAEKAVSDAQAAVDAATSAAQSEAEASDDFYIANARTEVSNAQSNVDDAKATLNRTPSSLSKTVIDGTLTDGGTYAYVANNNKWNSNVTTYNNYNGDVNDHINTFTQDELNELDNQTLAESVAYQKAGNIDNFQYYFPGVGEEYDGDQVVNARLTPAQQTELNTYAMMLVNKYRAAMGLDPMLSTPEILNGTQDRGKTIETDPAGILHHDENAYVSSLSRYGLTWSGECLSGIGLTDLTNIPMAEVFNRTAEAIQGLFNRDKDSNYGHRNILLTNAGTGTILGAFSLNFNTIKNTWGLVFDDSIVASADGQESALIDPSAVKSTTPTSHTVTYDNPDYTTAKTAFDEAQKQYDQAAASLKTIIDQYADHLEAKNGYDANVALDNAKAALTKAQSESDTADNTAAVMNAQTALDAAKSALNSAQSESDGNVAAAQAALTAAKAALTKAQNEKVAATTSPAQQALADAQAALTKAEATLAEATTIADQAQNDVAAAKQQAATAAAALSQAQAALDAANKAASTPTDSTSTGTDNNTSGQNTTDDGDSDMNNQPATNKDDSDTNNQPATNQSDSSKPTQTTGTDGQTPATTDTDSSKPATSTTTTKADATGKQSQQATTVVLSNKDNAAKTAVKLADVRSTQSLATTATRPAASATATTNNTAAKAYPQTGDNNDVAVAELGVLTVLGTLFGLAGVSKRRRN